MKTDFAIFAGLNNPAEGRIHLFAVHHFDVPLRETWLMASEAKLDFELFGDDSVEKVVADLYDRYGSWLFAMIKKSGTEDAAEDVVQETYLRLFSYLSRNETVRNPQSFLLAIARNIQRDRFRSTDRWSHPAFTSGLTARHTTFANDLQFESVFLKQIIASLPPLCRDVFVLHRFDGS